MLTHDFLAFTNHAGNLSGGEGHTGFIEMEIVWSAVPQYRGSRNGRDQPCQGTLKTPTAPETRTLATNGARGPVKLAIVSG